MHKYEKLRAKQLKRPLDRWKRIEKLARDAGFTGPHAVDLFLHDTTKMSKSKFLAYLGAGLARIGAASASGNSDLAAGLTAALLGFVDQSFLNGDLDNSWRAVLETEPVVVQRNPAMAMSIGLPDGSQKNVAYRLRFSQLIPAEILEVTLESAKQWQAWDSLQKTAQ